MLNTTLNEPKYPFSVKSSQSTDDFFKSHKIFLDYFGKIAEVIKHGASITISTKIEVEPWATFHRGSLCSMGAFSYSRSKLPQNTKVGRYCSIATDVEVLGIEHPVDWISTHVFTFRSYYRDAIVRSCGDAPEVKPFVADRGPVVIGNDVWICQGARLRPGIKIGDGSIIAAGAVVTKDVAPFSIVGGVPGKEKKDRFSKELQDRILRNPWWNYQISDFGQMDVSDPGAFMSELESRISSGLTPYSPNKTDLARALSELSSERPSA